MDMDISPGFSDGATSGAFSPMLDGVFNAEFFHYLQNIYQSRTGYHLILSDTNGSIQMGLPDCDKFPCMYSCRECREQIISEALRTGKVCMDACHEGYIIWGLPIAHAGDIIGGLIVIGGDLNSLKNRHSFEEACEELFVLMSDHGLLPHSETVSTANSDVVHRFVYRKAFSALDKELEEHAKPLIDSLQMAEFEAAREHFESIKAAFLEEKDLPMDLMRGFFSKLVFKVQSQFVDSGMDAYACLSEAGFLTELISKTKTRKQLEIGLDGFYRRFSRLSQQRTKDPDDLLVENATSYLEEHLGEDLTRDKVAKAVGISPSHFSRLIREKKGRTFTDLLNQYRIEHASRLLVRTSKTLADITNEAGFCDQSYFSKVFRRYKGMSPAKFKNTRKL